MIASNASTSPASHQSCRVRCIINTGFVYSLAKSRVHGTRRMQLPGLDDTCYSDWDTLQTTADWSE
ncbi:hypothetical protein PISMIDRAFT_411422 [Pisolithus microcarpus 441]|uniref:Uncharacterized protein n=1 Tax=Pisolithus microcarpus 441 TaxID=765257 RepID=A0A0C9YH89_9AGAM|nr:hypothetical protein PISMIDRAFT_411422 [Pisolithus microcarpus 441]